MPVMGCGGGCARMISVSSIRGGNPSAKAEPDAFAAEWSQCTSCGEFTCDRCLARDGGKCACGVPGRVRTEDERIAIALEMMGMGPAPAGPRPPGAIATTTITRPREGAPPVLAWSALVIGVLFGSFVGWVAIGSIGALLGGAVLGGIAYQVAARAR